MLGIQNAGKYDSWWREKLKIKKDPNWISRNEKKSEMKSTLHRINNTVDVVEYRLASL